MNIKQSLSKMLFPTPTVAFAKEADEELNYASENSTLVLFMGKATGKKFFMDAVLRDTAVTIDKFFHIKLGKTKSILK